MSAQIWITVKEASDKFGVSQSTIKRLISDKKSKLKAKKDGRAWKINVPSIAQHFANSPIQAPKKPTSEPLALDGLKNQLSHMQHEIEFLRDQIKTKDKIIAELTEAIRQKDRLIEHKPEEKAGVFSRALMRFGL